MPINSRLTAVLDRALSNKILSQRDIGRITAEANKDGVSEAEVDQIVEALAEAVQDGLELDTTGRKQRLNKLIDTLDTHHATGLRAETGPDGLRSFVSSLLAARGAPAAQTDDMEEVDLPEPSFAGRTIGVEDDGRITVDGADVPLDLSAASQDQIDAVMGLVGPGQLDILTPDAKLALADNLLGALSETWPIDGEAAGAFKKTVVSGTAAAALRGIAGDLNEATLDRVLAAFADAPNPMVKTLLLDVLEKATLTPAQQQQKDALEVPEHSAELLTAWDDMAEGRARIGWQDADGAVQQVALSALLYCKAPASMENLYKGMAVYKDFDGTGQPFNSDEVAHIAQDLETYTEKHGGLAYVFGTFESDAPKHLARRLNKRLVADLAPRLDGGNPRLGDVDLSRDQAAWVKDILVGIKDERAADQLEDALKEVALLSSPEPRGYGQPPVPSEPLSPAAFDLLKRTVTPHFDSRDGTEDGMIDTRALTSDVKETVAQIREPLQPRLAQLAETPPRWADFEVGDATRDLLHKLVKEHIRSPMSVSNLDKALHVVAERHGGVTGQGETVFNNIVRDYMANWPDLQTFDFNKLERIAKFAVDGRDVPLCTLNGQSIGLSEFYGKVAEAVTESIDTSSLRHEWMAARWGYRAKESVELLDVIAERTAAGTGPVKELQAKFPGKEIEVQATGLDGVHQQFLYAVKDGGRVLHLWNESSDGEVARYTDNRKEPVLFTAVVGDDGAFDVQVPRQNRARRYPLQTTYGVGDSIDVAFRDATATEVRTEGEKFDTRYKVVEGRITGFDNSGNYTVMVNKPGGGEEEQRLSLDQIRRMNHPHFFSETGSWLRDTEINISNDQPLKEFLEDADTIIERHLPKDGSQAHMSAAELARRQKKVVDGLMAYCADKIKYPRGKDSASAAEDVRYHELDELHRFPLGELVKIGRGVCRHQCILYHLLLQRAGIDSRLASGAANTSSGNYRGLHLWVELTLADNERYLSDQTWKDEVIPLWNGAYDSDKRRLEIYNRTEDFDREMPSDR